MEYTEEQLNAFDKAPLVQLFLVQQSQFQAIDKKRQLLLEQYVNATPLYRQELEFQRMGKMNQNQQIVLYNKKK
jgi:hypothetical protein